MKNQVIQKTIVLLVLISLVASAMPQGDSPIIWQSGATDRVYASPVVLGDKIYTGSIDGYLHCTDLLSGRKYYQFQTNGPITSTPVIYKNNIILVSGNNLICYDPENISEKWRFLTEAHPDQARFDEWDYHHSSPIIFGGEVYFGCGNGVLYVIDPENGQQSDTWTTQDYAPIRSTPTIADSVLYFGDWEGVIYAIDLPTKTAKWSRRTWTGQHYDNFAGILSHIEVGDNLLYYGARNQNIHAINKTNGSITWTYTSPDGGWISGDPVLYGDYLLIGGSDNHKMLCFNANNGDLLWDFDFPGNCFSKPLITNDKLIFTTGNAYANTGENYGRGFVHVLNLPGGELFNELELPGNVFSNPVIYNGQVYVGCDNKNLYALDGFVMAGIETSSIGNLIYKPLQYPVSRFQVFPNPINNESSFSFFLKEPGNIKIEIFDLAGRGIDTINRQGLPAGNNAIEITENTYNLKSARDNILLARISFNNAPSGSMKIFKN